MRTEPALWLELLRDVRHRVPRQRYRVIATSLDAWSGQEFYLIRAEDGLRWIAADDRQVRVSRSP